MRELLDNPDPSVLPRSAWPDQLRSAHVRAPPAEWLRIVKGLREWNLVEFLEADELVTHRGQVLTAGAFGIGKNKTFTTEVGAQAEVLRFIINMTPSNELQTIISGDIGTLPAFTMWSGIELLSSEVVLFTSEDMRCAFYLFRLPRCWKRWLVVGPGISATALGAPASDSKAASRLLWPAMVVVPMGWISAVG